MRGSPSLRLPDFAGRPAALSPNPANWQPLNPAAHAAGDILLLGIGPGEPENLPFAREALARGATIHWLDDPAFLAMLRQAGGMDFREKAGRLAFREAMPGEDLARLGRAFFYRPALKFSPFFWGPILARLDMAAAVPERQAEQKKGNSPKKVWLPGHAGLLLHAELAHALKKLGADIEEGELWVPGAGQAPDYALSVNFQGLDPDGRAFWLCREMEVPLAIWLVDNPWHILSGQKLPWWREAFIFVTDESFIPELRANGAKHVYHCPLAASWHMWRPVPEEAAAPPLFVGSSAFQARDSFFCGINIAPVLEKEAARLMEAGQPPDYHWWSAKCGLVPWPGLGARAPGKAADACSRENRLRWLQALKPAGLRVAGDEGWRRYFPDALGPVDYYGALPELYREAECVLNVTSLLLPKSLNQRHFDVWAAGGFLLGDAAGGLDLFPADLREPITLKSPGEFAPRLEWLRQRPRERLDIIRAWREHLREWHSYERRLAFMLEKIRNRP